MLYSKTAASTLILTLALANLHAPQARAQEGTIPNSAEICMSSREAEAIHIPYSAIAEAEELIADGTIDPELVAALENVDVDYVIVGPQPRALPAIAAAAVAVTAWCVNGALASLVPSALQEMASRAFDGIEPPDWVMNAIFGCAGGPVLGALASQALRLKFAAAVLAAVIKLRNFG